MKKLLWALVWLVLSGVSAASPVISLNPLNSSINTGSTTTVSIDLSGGVDVFAYQFDILFTSGLLSVSQATSGLFLSDGTGFFPGIVDDAAGSISFISDAVVGAGPGVSGNGNLASLVFTGLGGGVANLRLANVILLDSSFADITGVTTVDTSITVTAVNAIPAPNSALLAMTALLAAGFAARPRRQVRAQPTPVR